VPPHRPPTLPRTRPRCPKRPDTGHARQPRPSREGGIPSGPPHHNYVQMLASTVQFSKTNQHPPTTRPPDPSHPTAVDTVTAGGEDPATTARAEGGMTRGQALDTPGHPGGPCQRDACSLRTQQCTDTPTTRAGQPSPPHDGHTPHGSRTLRAAVLATHPSGVVCVQPASTSYEHAAPRGHPPRTVRVSPPATPTKGGVGVRCSLERR